MIRFAAGRDSRYIGRVAPTRDDLRPVLDRSVRDLHEMRERMEHAENAFDPAYFVEIMADDVALMVPDFPVQEGKPAASAFVRDVMGWQREHLNRRITYTSAEVRSVGDVAIDRGTFGFTVAEKGSDDDATSVRGKYLWLYRRQRTGSWKIWRVIMALDEQDEDGPESGA